MIASDFWPFLDIDIHIHPWPSSERWRMLLNIWNSIPRILRPKWNFSTCHTSEIFILFYIEISLWQIYCSHLIVIDSWMLEAIGYVIFELSSKFYFYSKRFSSFSYLFSLIAANWYVPTHMLRTWLHVNAGIHQTKNLGGGEKFKIQNITKTFSHSTCCWINHSVIHSFKIPLVVFTKKFNLLFIILAQKINVKTCVSCW